MNEFLTWGALIAAGGSIVAVVRFWIDIGRLYERANDASKSATIATANTVLLSEKFASFQVDVARTYVTAGALNHAMEGVYSRLDNMTQRLDSLITMSGKQQ